MGVGLTKYFINGGVSDIDTDTYANGMVCT